MNRLLVPSSALMWGLQVAFLSPSLALILSTLYGASTAEIGWVLAIYNVSALHRLGGGPGLGRPAPGPPRPDAAQRGAHGTADGAARRCAPPPRFRSPPAPASPPPVPPHSSPLAHQAASHTSSLSLIYKFGMPNFVGRTLSHRIGASHARPG